MTTTKLKSRTARGASLQMFRQLASVLDDTTGLVTLRLFVLALKCAEWTPSNDMSAIDIAEHLALHLQLPHNLFEIGGEQEVECGLLSQAVARLQSALQHDDIDESDLASIAEGLVNRSASGTYYTDVDVVDHVIDMSDCVSAHSVLDPTCGSGAFLVQMLKRKVAAGDSVGAALESLYGVDLSPVAVEACRIRLALCAREFDAACSVDCVVQNVVVGDAIASSREWWKQVFPRVFSTGGFAAAIGNPPYVRAPIETIPDHYVSQASGSLAAIVAERTLDIVMPGGTVGLVMPVSWMSTDAFGLFRTLLQQRLGRVRISSFDAVPSPLFAGTVQRIAILTGVVGGNINDWQVTRYHRWKARERSGLLDRLEFVPMHNHRVHGSIAKVGSLVEHELIDTLIQYPALGTRIQQGQDATGSVLYKRRWSYHLLFLDFVPEMYDAHGDRRFPSEFKKVTFNNTVDPKTVLGALNSSLFYWFYTIYSDNRNVNRRDIGAFPFPAASDALADVAVAANELMQKLLATSELRECHYKTIGTITNRYFFHSRCAEELAAIDDAIADAYELNITQREFLHNFERRFRFPQY